MAAAVHVHAMMLLGTHHLWISIPDGCVPRKWLEAGRGRVPAKGWGLNSEAAVGIDYWNQRGQVQIHQKRAKG